MLQERISSLIDQFLTGLPLVPLYAEIHYRFKYFPFSHYFKKAPEIIFDAPWRINPGKTPLVYLLIKDADRYPIRLHELSLKWESSTGDSGERVIQLDTEISHKWYYRIYHLANSVKAPATLSVLPELSYSRIDQKRVLKIRVDNCQGLSKRPLQIFLANESLPAFSGWLQGDMHIHSALTNDQVEFGAPLKMTQHAATILGIDFLTPTDHSYDLDDDPDNFLKSDRSLQKWDSSRSSISELNAANHELARVIPGEEITVRNENGKNVHLLHFNDSQFFSGSGDGAESWFNTRSEHTISEVLAHRNPSSVSIAAHPYYHIPKLQRWLIGRDEWHLVDLQTPGLEGAQVLSGIPRGPDFELSRRAWIQALLGGAKLAIIGGSDAHGNFNRFRQVNLPMWSLHEHDDQVLGQARTVVQAADNSIHSILRAIRARKTGATTGPVGTIQLTAGEFGSAGIGDELVCSGRVNITLEAKSTIEFGSVTGARLICGNPDSRQETRVWEAAYTDIQSFELVVEREVELTGRGYIRLEIDSGGNSRWPGIYLSSPLWFAQPV